MKRELRQAVELYESFREKRPQKLGRATFKLPKVVAVIGHVEGIDYRTTHGKKVTLYHHDFEPGSRPLLCVSSDGRQLMLLGGRYRFTDRGIVDHDHKGNERPDPKHGRYVNPKLTLRTAQAELRAIGLTLTKRDDEYVVKFAGKGEDDPRTYFTDDLSDAVVTGRLMATQDPAHRKIVSTAVEHFNEDESAA